MQVATGIGAAAVAATIAAVILGEYPLTGFTPWTAAIVLGLLLAEIALSLGKVRTAPVAASVGAFAAAAILYAGWISSGEGVAPYPGVAWPAAAVAAAVAVAWLWPRAR